MKQPKFTKTELDTILSMVAIAGAGAGDGDYADWRPASWKALASIRRKAAELYLQQSRRTKRKATPNE